MPSLDRSLNSFRAAGTNERLDFNFSWCTSGDPTSGPFKIWSGSRVPCLVKESVAHKRQSSAGCMPEKIGRWSVKVRRRHSLAMRKASIKTLSMRRLCALRHQTGAHLSVVE